MGPSSCSYGWREISPCVCHQDGGEELEDPSLVGISIVLSVRDPVIFSKDGQREEDEGTTRAIERMVEGLVGLTIESLTQVQVWGSTPEDLRPTMVMRVGLCTWVGLALWT